MALLAILVAIDTAAGAGSDAFEYPSRTQAAFDEFHGNGTGRTSGSVSCPHSHPHVTGGGIEISGDNSHLGLSVGSIRPAGRAGAWDADANNGSGSPAQMTTTAICAEAGRFEYPFRDKTIAPGGQDQLRVSCPANTKVTGGGVETTSENSPHVEVASTEPFDGQDRNSTPDDGWLGTANNDTAQSEEMGVFAVCAESGDYKYVHSDRKRLPDNSEVSADARCPAGTAVTGGGVDNSGIDLGAEIAGTLPFDGGDIGFTPDDGWEGSAQNDHTGRATRMQTFAICEVSEVRTFFGTANGGTVTFRTKFEDGKTRKVLGLEILNVPISCDQRDTTHGFIDHDRLEVKNNAFVDHAPAEHGQDAFAITGRFNNRGTEASGTYQGARQHQPPTTRHPPHQLPLGHRPLERAGDGMSADHLDRGPGGVVGSRSPAGVRIRPPDRPRRR